MRASAVGLLAALVVLGACVAAERPAPGNEAARMRALRAARVWREPARPIASADLAANPEGPDTFGRDEDVSCTFHLHPSEGWSPKFTCALPSGEELKVKYGHGNAEVFAEVAATRLLSALGFGADRMYVVRSVKCQGCPLHPYPKVPFLDAVERNEGREVTFDVAVLERKMPGRSIRGATTEGWAWFEADRIDAAAGGASRAEVDALRLAGVFLGHWDNKASNQRLVCLDEGAATDACASPFAYLQDVGQTFGPRSVDLDGWRRAPIWADAATCRVSMKDLPYQGATFGEARIGEAGRRFLGDRLRQLSHAQIVALFAGARFPQLLGRPPANRDVEAWAQVFEDRVRQVADRPPCPP
jgi:hypothetical protein